MTSKKFWKLYLLLLPLLMILAIAGLTGYGATMLKATPQRAQTTQPVQPLPAAARPPQAENDALKEQATELKNDADALKAKEDDLKWILGFILGAAALFAAGQAAGTWFSAQTFTKQAENTLVLLGQTKNEINSAKDDLNSRSKETLAAFDQAQKEVRANSEELQKAREALNARMQETLLGFDKTLKARYPIYAQMADLWGDAYRNLTTILESASPGQNPDESFYWGRGLYEKMSLKFRRQLISAQQIAPYEIAGQSEPDRVYVQKVRRLARFYWSKFLYERALGAASLSDLEQAEYLLNQAMRRVGEVFYLLNDRGNIFLAYYNAHLKALPAPRTDSEEADLQRVLICARRDLQDSLDAQKDQLRAYFNLAYIEAECGPPATQQERLTKAIGYIRNGLQYVNWEKEPVPEFTCKAIYNLACYCARLPRTEATQNECLAALQEAAKIGLADPTDVDRDFNSPSGDFYGMLQALPPAKLEEFKKVEGALSSKIK